MTHIDVVNVEEFHSAMSSQIISTNFKGPWSEVMHIKMLADFYYNVLWIHKSQKGDIFILTIFYNIVKTKCGTVWLTLNPLSDLNIWSDPKRKQISMSHTLGSYKSVQYKSNGIIRVIAVAYFTRPRKHNFQIRKNMSELSSKRETGKNLYNTKYQQCSPSYNESLSETSGK